MGGDDDGHGKPSSKGKQFKEDLLARAREARKREARAQDVRKEEWQTHTKSTNLLGVLGSTSFGLAQAGQMSSSVMTEISSQRDRAVARVQQMSSTAAPSQLTAMAQDHFSTKEREKPELALDEHKQRLRNLAKFTLLALVIYISFSGLFSLYHDVLTLVSPEANEVDRVEKQAKMPFEVESYAEAMDTVDPSAALKNLTDLERSLQSQGIGQDGQKWTERLPPISIRSELESELSHVPSKHKDVKKEKPSVLGTLDSEMHEAGVTLFGAQSHANPLLDGFFGEDKQNPADLTGLSGVTEAEETETTGEETVTGEIEAVVESIEETVGGRRKKKSKKAKDDPATEEEADKAEEVKELKEEEAEQEAEEKEKYAEATQEGANGLAATQARSARTWTQETIRKQLESLGQKMLVLSDGQPLPAAESTQPPEFTQQSLKPSSTWPEAPSVVSNTMAAANTKQSSYAHMATLTRMPTAAPWRYMTVWQTGQSLEGTKGQHLRSSFSDDGEAWTPPVVIPVARDGSGKALWAPVLFTHFDHVYLFFAESVSCLRPAEGDKPPRWAPGGDVRMSRSKDGVTWSLPVTIYTQATKNGMPKLISNPPEIVNDRFVLPFWRERPPTKCSCKFSAKDFTAAGVLISGEGGAGPWKPYGELKGDAKTYLIEGAVALKPDGNLLQVFRTKAGKIYQSLSMDGGQTWTAGGSAGLPNPGSKVNTLRLSTGEVALAYNNNAEARNTLTVALSGDGSHWYNIAQLEGTTAGYMYGYPTMAQDGDKLLVAYSVMLKSKDMDVSKGGIRVAIIQLPRPSNKLKAEEEASQLASPRRKRAAHEAVHEAVHETREEGRTSTSHAKRDEDDSKTGRKASSRKHGR